MSAKINVEKTEGLWLGPGNKELTISVGKIVKLRSWVYRLEMKVHQKKILYKKQIEFLEQSTLVITWKDQIVHTGCLKKSIQKVYKVN